MIVFQVKRGTKANMPSLSEGELYYATDEGRLYVGTSSSYIGILPEQDPVIKGEIGYDSIVSADSSVDWTDGNIQAITLTGNTTLTFTAPSKPGPITLIVKQDATGGRTLTFPSGINWLGASVPTLGTDANQVTIYKGGYYGPTYGYVMGGQVCGTV